MDYVITMDKGGSSKELKKALDQGHTIVMAVPMNDEYMVVMRRPEPETLEALHHCLEEIEETLKHPESDDYLRQVYKALLNLYQRFGG